MRRELIRAAVTAATVGAIGVTAAPALGAQPRARVGRAAVLPAGAHVTGKVASSTPISLSVALAPRDPLALKRYATAVSTPGNRNQGAYLSVPEFRQRFAPVGARITAVRAALRAEGLKVSHVTANGLSLHVSGHTAAVEHAFRVQLRSVRTAGGRSATTNVTAPTLPADVAPYVQSVIGLDTTRTVSPEGGQRVARGVRPHPAGKPGKAKLHADVATGGPQPCASATDVTTEFSNNPAGEPDYFPYTADSMANAYGFSGFYGQGDFGQAQRIGLIELGQAYNPTDIQAYDSCYGVSTAINPVNVDGGPPAGSGTGEYELDLEVIAGMAPQADIDAFQAPNTASALPDAMSAAVSANIDKVVSISYGGCEEPGDPAVTAEETDLEEAAIQGQSFLASSGDSGSVCDGSSTLPSVNDPASDPFITGVGGTALYGGGSQATGNFAAYPGTGTATQSVWNEGVDPSSFTPTGGGGGISSLWTMPQYQYAANPALGVGNGASETPCGGTAICREVPDVSADADTQTGYVVDINDPTAAPGSLQGWQPFGGTSAASPLWASYIALTDDLAVCGGKGLGLLNPSLYQIAGANYAGNFQDVANGSPLSSGQAYPASNDALGTNGGTFPVAAGYDMATGLGTMNGATGNSLCASRPVVSLATPAAQTTVVNTPVSLPVTGADSTGQPLSYISSGLPAGLTLNPATGAVTGTPTTPGVSTVTVEAIDTTGVAAGVTFTWSIVTPPPPPKKPKKKTVTNRPSKATLAGTSNRRPKLFFDWNVATGSKALTGIELKVPKGFTITDIKALRRGGLVVKSNGKAIAARFHYTPRTLLLRFRHKVTKLRLGIRYPALRLSKSEARKIKRGSVKKLKFGVTGISGKKQLKRTIVFNRKK